jgi:class 3 adenylate cyclase
VGQQRRRLAAILVAGYSRLTGVDEEGTLARLRALRREVVDPALAEHYGRLVKTTGDGLLIEFASVVDAVRCAIAVQRGMAHRNTEVAPERRILFRVGINLGDVVAEGDDLLGDGVNVAARLEGIAEPGGICLSRAAYDQARGKVDLAVRDLGEQRLKNIAEPVRVFAVELGGSRSARPRSRTARRAVIAAVIVVMGAVGAGAWYWRSAIVALQTGSTAAVPPLSIVVLPFANLGGDPSQQYLADVLTEGLTTSLRTTSRVPRDRAQHRIYLPGQARGREAGRQGACRSLRARRQRAAQWRQSPRECAAHRRRERDASVGRPVR